MEIKYSATGDALLIRLKSGQTTAKTVQINHSVNADLDEAGDVIALEFLGASKYIEGLNEYLRTEQTISVQEMADMHNMSAHNVHIILRQDQEKPETERRIPGAYKDGDERRGNWRIPLAAAEAFIPDKRGRKAK